MPSFETLGELEFYVTEVILKNGAKVIKEFISEELKRFVKEDLYEAYDESPLYKRTGDLINSITTEVKQLGGKYFVDIFFDGDKMGHFSLAGSNKLGILPFDQVYIPQWVNDGDTWGREDVGFMEDTMNSINSGGVPRFVREFINYLKTQNISVKVG